jgi:hypothetical protein
MMDLILDACPSFRPTYEEFLAEWEGDEPAVYLALGDVARHLEGMMERGETKQFPEIFAVVERWHVEGEHFVREAATVGLLEGIQDPIAPDQSPFLPYLGAESRYWWDKLIRFWHHGEMMVDDRPDRPIVELKS